MVKKILTFECEICGFTSKDKDLVTECESAGEVKPQYMIGDKVKKMGARGRIKKTIYEITGLKTVGQSVGPKNNQHRRHVVQYTLVWINPSDGVKGKSFTALEHNIVSVDEIM